jgi:hypothetical protein
VGPRSGLSLEGVPYHKIIFFFKKKKGKKERKRERNEVH